ncbi:polysaccharide biosynthesis protein [Lactiplantibacillus carotarum]|uniref:polysaccharide biosynthesis protein n=1 Tax=Lactiplantibacillus carotarum TaxID=2993456 RepID=UPI00298EEE05|nr:polysaccharide biosynthesis protein [Lactiplantibacillus carotarum]
MIKDCVNFLQRHVETAYLSLFALYLLSVTINTTTFYVYYPHRIAVIIQLMTAGLLLLKIVCFDQLTAQETIWEVSLLGLVTIIALISSAHYLVVTALLIIGARGVDFRRIVRVYLWLVGVVLLLAWIAAMFGVIKNITFVTTSGLRQSFGVVYTTDFAAHVFYWCCAYLYLIAKRFRVVSLIPVLAATGVIYYFTRTWTDTIAMIILIITFLAYVYRRQLSHVKLVRVSLRYNFLAIPIISLSIIWLSAVFSYSDRVLVKLNGLLSNRLALGNNAFLAYGVKILGQPLIPVNGWGGDRSETFTNDLGNLTYFFIDSSFINMLVSYGLLITLVVVLGITVFLYLRTRKNDYLLPVIFLAIAIASAFDQHFLEVTYNVFILASFSKLPFYQTKLKPSFNNLIVHTPKSEERSI